MPKNISGLAKNIIISSILIVLLFILLPGFFKLLILIPGFYLYLNSARLLMSS